MIAEQFDAFFFDLDGVIYIGGTTTPGAARSLSRLRSMGRKVRFLTNNPTTRSRIACRLQAHGIDAEVGEVITAGSAAGLYLAEQGIERAWILGESGLAEEVAEAGISCVGEKDCDAVVVGWDETATLASVRRAALAIRKGARFIASNVDRTFPSPEGPLAGVGALVEALRTASGKDPEVVGKPFAPMFDEAVESVDLPPERILMIGDTPESDILGAHRRGITALLMGDEPFPGSGDFRRPDGRIDSLEDLFDPERSVTLWKLPGSEDGAAQSTGWREETR